MFRLMGILVINVVNAAVMSGMVKRITVSDAGERDPCKIGERDANFDL